MTDETQPGERRVRAAYLRIERSDGYCHPILSFGSAPSYDPNDGSSNGYGEGFYGAGSMLDRHAPALPKGCSLEDLHVTAQGESKEPGKLYGWEYEFKRHRVREHDVAGMARTFRHVARALDKAQHDAGNPGTWADFALRICRAFKVTRLYVRVPDHAPSSMVGPVRRYDGNGIHDGLHWGEWHCWTDSERSSHQTREDS